MKRRKLIRYATDGALAAIGAGLWTQLGRPVQAQAVSGLSIQWLGHMCFLFTGSGKSILVNPFESIGCTAGYPSPRASADYVLISSYLLDEGNIAGLPGNPEVLDKTGSYTFGSLKIEGIESDHDLIGGFQFGTNVMWKWSQSGMSVAHLGGAAAPITDEQKILLGRPDVLLLPVGGGPKAYGPEQARDAIATLNPRIVIPTQYYTDAADERSCDLEGVDAFINLVGEDFSVQRIGNVLDLGPSDLTDDKRLKIFSL
ncbi:MAG: MBL fold metallo-hydrolase [Cyanobacteria bacterium P01_F01_bin.150]